MLPSASCIVCLLRRLQLSKRIVKRSHDKTGFARTLAVDAPDFTALPLAVKLDVLLHPLDPRIGLGVSGLKGLRGEMQRLPPAPNLEIVAFLENWPDFADLAELRVSRSLTGKPTSPSGRVFQIEFRIAVSDLLHRLARYDPHGTCRDSLGSAQGDE